ncbi:MAG: methylated-DNA--[protein]-cysteine S-methyltransferase [Actinomycetia bacterium]|nr:methylated-DNA--[protein]-cysteine S-methyltransferase [Actinomycetes bacterium]
MTLFDTSIGRVGIAWRDEVVIGVQIPELDDRTTLRQLAITATTSDQLTTAAAPPAVQTAIGAITSLLDGEAADLDGIDVDLDAVGPFDRAVYEVTRSIPPGESLTYGEVAAGIGEPGAAQAVGRSLGANPFPIVIPCHRVLGAGGHLTGFSAAGGIETKRKMLLIEGCPAVPPSLFD